MIIYFTGTGNSKFVAEALAHRLEDEVTSFNDILTSEAPWEFSSEKPYVIVCPVYAWRIPPVIAKLITEGKFEGNDRMYVVVTMGKNTGKADENTAEIVKAKGLTFMGFTGIVMTDNYSTRVDDATVKENNEKALKVIDSVAEDIRSGRAICKTDKTSFAWLKSGMINDVFMKHDPGFKVSDKCIGCGKCQRFCPAKNITITDKRPVFGRNCFQCLGCLHRCPVGAIDTKHGFRGTRDFVCPEYKPE